MNARFGVQEFIVGECANLRQDLQQPIAAFNLRDGSLRRKGRPTRTGYTCGQWSKNDAAKRVSHQNSIAPL